MADEQVRIDLTANDKASKVIDDVADSAEKLEKLDPEVEISAADKASKMMGEILADLDKLDAADPTVTIDADNNASRAIADVAGDVDKLTAADHELVLKARIDAAKGELRSLQSELDDTGDHAKATERQLDKIGDSKGPGLAGNAVSDMTGPLGDVSSAASDIAGVFDGLGDVVGSAAAKVGLDAEKMAGAITGIGFAVTAAAAAWAYYRQKQAAAREKQEELVRGQRDFNKAVADGDRAAAAAKFTELYADAFKAADRAGVSVNDLTRYITGQTNAIPGLAAKLADLEAATELHADRTAEDVLQAQGALRAYQALTGTIDDARDSYKGANGTIADQARQLGQVESALGTASRATSGFVRTQAAAKSSTEDLTTALDRMQGELDVEQLMLDFQRNVIAAVETVGQSALDQQGDILALKQSVKDAGELFKKNPLEIETELKEIDAGNIAQVTRDVQAWYAAHPIILASKLDRPGQIVAGGSGGGGTGPRSAPASTIVNVNMPAGSRGVDVLRQVSGQARRSGTRYGARVVHYARR